MSTPLDDAAIAAALSSLDGWSHEDHALSRSYSLADFRSALAFLVQIGFEAEERNHHPELRNVYSSVSIRLTTHDVGNRVTDKDVDLARAIEALAPRYTKEA